MKFAMAIIRELWSLFVDDRGLAVALLAWCCIGGVIFPHFLWDAWRAPALLAGVVSILLIDIALSVKAYVRRR